MLLCFCVRGPAPTGLHALPLHDALPILTAAGLNAGLIVAPVLPGVTDDLPRLEALFGAARDAGARFLHAGPLRLYPAIRDQIGRAHGLNSSHVATSYAVFCLKNNKQEHL